MRTAIVVLASLLAFAGCEKQKAEESEDKQGKAEAPTVEQTAEREEPAAKADETPKAEQPQAGSTDELDEMEAEDEEELSDDEEE